MTTFILPDDVVADGITTELCAGIVDKKDMSLAAIARDEVEEECGYRLQVDELQHIQTFRSAIGTGGAKMSLFYAEVSDEKKVSSGGGLVEEGEMIEVIEMSVNEVRRLISKEDINSPPFTLYGIQWFLRNKV
jgi:UDP-sugar diphosphatase